MSVGQRESVRERRVFNVYHFILEKESDDNDDNDVDKHPVDRLQKPKVYDNVEDVEELLAKTQKVIHWCPCDALIEWKTTGFV